MNRRATGLRRTASLSRVLRTGRALGTRRAVGLGMLAAALVCVLSVPGILGRRTTGSAVRGPIPPPPRAAQCLGPISTPQQYLALVDQVPVVPCADPHSSEVVVVVAHGLAVRPATLAAAELAGPTRACNAAVAAYTGIDRPNASHRVLPRFTIRMAVPSQVQWNGGQRWYACEVLPATEELPIAYSGTARNVYTGRPPAAFATCAQSIGGPAVPCSEPHGAEELSRITEQRPHQPVFGETFELNCPLAATDIVGPRAASDLLAVPWARGNTQSCWAQAANGGLLTGTVIGLGDAPLPLSGG